MSAQSQTARRARTREQKALRRRAILDAADGYFSGVGFEAFSMAELAARAGVAKGTLYLYFETREEVLLTLHCEKLEAWVHRIEHSLPTELDDQTFAGLFYDSAYLDPALLPLMSRLDSVIEHNVSVETLIGAKRAMAALLERLSRTIAPKLALSAGQAFEALAALGALLLGAFQVDTGPQIEADVLPDDVRRLMSAFSSRDVFTTNACRILAGLRSE